MYGMNLGTLIINLTIMIASEFRRNKKAGFGRGDVGKFMLIVPVRT